MMAWRSQVILALSSLAEVSSDLAMDDAVRRLMREDCGDAGGCVNIQNGVPSSGLK
jgi:hypothetical protein